MRWVVCEGFDGGHEPDSRVHRYDREKGFSISEEELAATRRNESMREAERESRLRAKQSSHAQTVTRWAFFERYCRGKSRRRRRATARRRERAALWRARPGLLEC